MKTRIRIQRATAAVKQLAASFDRASESVKQFTDTAERLRDAMRRQEPAYQWRHMMPVPIPYPEGLGPIFREHFSGLLVGDRRIYGVPGDHLSPDERRAKEHRNWMMSD